MIKNLSETNNSLVMVGVLDPLHLWGVTVIHDIQFRFQSYSNLMMFLSYIGDPRFAFTFYFPVAYFLNYSVGKRIMWVAAITELLNAVAKWILHGERPYWWVHESELNSQEDVPHLKQFEITCETGPGSPSGHAMITGAVLYILISDFLSHMRVTRQKNILSIHSLFYRAMCWTFYITVMCCIAMSRLFIATHFPHQVVAGILAGIFLGKLFQSFSTTNLKLRHYAIVCFGLTVCTALVYTLVKLLATDPLWSLEKATKWCADKNWVHLDTTVFYSLIRDVSSLLGLGIAVWLHAEPEKNSSNKTVTCLRIVLAVALTTFLDGLKPGQNNLLLFYFLGFVKHVLTVCFVVVVIPLVLGIISVV